jgi:hypothetical protein
VKEYGAFLRQLRAVDKNASPFNSKYKKYLTETKTLITCNKLSFLLHTSTLKTEVEDSYETMLPST